MKIFAKTRMLVALGALLFVGSVLTSTVSYLISRNSIRDSLLQTDLPLSSNNIYSEIQRDLLEPILISSLMANDTFVRGWIDQGEADESAIVDYLGHIQKKYGTVTSFLVSEHTRKYYNTKGVLKIIDEEVPIDKWFFRVREMKTDYEINVDPDMSNQNAMTIFINYRVVDKEGHFLAATGVGLAANAVKALMQEYQAKYKRDVYFYDRKGHVVLQSVEDQKSDHRPEPLMHSILQRIEKGEQNVSASGFSQSGALDSYRYIPELEWVLVVEQTSDGTRGILWKTVGINLVVCFAISVILLGVIRSLVLRYQKDLEGKTKQLFARKHMLSKANAARDKLFSIIGHDLRGPIGNVKTTLDMLKEGSLSQEEFNELSEEVSDAVNHILLALENLIAWGSTQSGSLQSRDEKVNLREAAEQSIQLLGMISRKKGILVENLVPEDAEVLADGDQIQFILRNLLSNAIKFTQNDGKISFTAAREKSLWRIGVADTGIGMDAKRLMQLSEQKTEAESTLGTAREKGFGIGLQLCFDFVHSNGGILKFESEPGKGTTAYVALNAYAGITASASRN